MPSKHLILSRPLFLLPSIFPGIRVFSNESVLVELIWVGGMEGPIDDVWCEFSSQGNWSASEFLNSSCKDTYLPRGAVFLCCNVFGSTPGLYPIDDGSTIPFPQFWWPKLPLALPYILWEATWPKLRTTGLDKPCGKLWIRIATCVQGFSKRSLLRKKYLFTKALWPKKPPINPTSQVTTW